MSLGRWMRWATLAEGRRPSEFAMKPTLKGGPVICLARAQKLGLQVTSGVLLSAEVIRRFEWEK